MRLRVRLSPRKALFLAAVGDAEFLHPFVKAKELWPYPPDVMYWDEWPVAHPFLLFGAVVFDERTWFNTWIGLDHDPKVEEVIRNLPVKSPLIWMQTPK